MALSDGIYVRLADDGFIEVQAVQHQFGVDVGSVLRIERGSAADVAAHLTKVAADEGPQRSEVAANDDVVTFRIGGPEQAPILNLINRRGDGSESVVAVPWDKLAEVVRGLEGVTAAA